MLKRLFVLFLLLLSFSNRNVLALAGPLGGKASAVVGTPLDASLPTFQTQIIEAQQNNDPGAEWYNKIVNNYQILSIADGIFGHKIYDANGNLVTENGGGAVQFFASSMGGLYETPPATTYAYVNYMARNAGFEPPVKTAYAASGIGFSALDPVMKIWQVMRNIAYLALSIVFVVVGLMIVLRVKIDPKTVITIQNALPKMILSMILITFSYPIAGFLIDLMYVLIGVIMNLADSTGIISANSMTNFKNGLTSSTIFGFMGVGGWWGVTSGVAGSISNAVSELATGFQFGNINVAGVGASALAYLIVGVAILYALFKTWLSLVGAYVNILIGTIFSPFAMLGEAIPGFSSFGTWLRSMVAALISFPTVILLLVFGKAIMEYGENYAAGAGSSAGAFVPPLIGGNNASAVTSLIGLGILLMIPKAVEMISELIKSPPFKYGMAWQESFGAGQGALQKGWGTAYGDRWSRVSAEAQKQAAARELGADSNKVSWTGQAVGIANDPIGSLLRRGQKTS